MLLLADTSKLNLCQLSLPGCFGLLTSLILMHLSKAYLRNALNLGVFFSIFPVGRSRSGLRGYLGSSFDLACSFSKLYLVRGPNVLASRSFNAAMAPSRAVSNSFSLSVAASSISSSAFSACFRLRNEGKNNRPQ